MRIVLLYLVLIFTAIKADAQALVSMQPFSIASGNLEPDGRRDALKISAKEFVTLSKTKGATAGPSEFVLEKYNDELKVFFKSVITVGEEEDLQEIYFNGKDIVVFSVIHENVKKTSKLVAYGFSTEDGSKKWDKVLDEFKVNDYAAIKYKGAVKESFENCVSSCITRHYVTPFNYQFVIRISPDKKKVLTYIFDYSQKTLVANVKLFDKDLNELTTAMIPVDNNFINYGIYPNNRGDVYILNVDRLGRVVVIQYNLSSKENKLLDLQYTSAYREGLVFHLLSDDVAYVANICSKDKKLLGVLYAKFDFAQNVIDKINYHEISDAMRQTVTLMRNSNKSLPGEETWRNYQITDFRVNEYEKVVMVLEKREIVPMGFDNSQASDVNEPDKWKEKTARVNVEGMLLFSWNKDDELLWENVYLKSQLADVTAGLLSSSYSMDISDEGKVRMVFAFSNSSSGIMNSINYLEWDELSGNKVKEITLQNDEGISMLRGYTIWMGDKLVVAGRKGLLGKKSFIATYKLE